MRQGLSHRVDPVRATGRAPEKAENRLASLHDQGLEAANLYGHDETVYGGLNAFFLLMDTPETYNLPDAANAVLPKRNNRVATSGMLATAVLGRLRRC